MRRMAVGWQGLQVQLPRGAESDPAAPHWQVRLELARPPWSTFRSPRDLGHVGPCHPGDHHADKLEPTILCLYSSEVDYGGHATV